MRWILRHAVFALFFSLGSTAWYILAQQESTPAPPARIAQEPTINQETAPTASEQPEALPVESIRFGPIEPILGYSNTETVVIRESTDANAPVVARLKTGDYKEIFILGATRDFLHVRLVAENSAADGLNETKQYYQGWTTWGSVMPEMSAIVMDAETGSVISRVPLSQGLSSVIFSPDGSRALFAAESSGVSQVAYEVITSDYTLMRSLTPLGSESFSPLFYEPASGEVYARIYSSGEKLVRSGEGGAKDFPAGLSPNIVVSPDSMTGLIARREEDDTASVLTIDVMDLATLQVRNTFKLSGANPSEDGRGFVLSRDGAELYLRPSESTRAIRVIDTRTGQLLRELPASATQDGSYFGQESIVGDSVLLTVWDEAEDEMHEAPTRYWISNGKRMLAEPGVAFAVDAAGKRYAVNEEGTRLFRLNDNNRIQKRFLISRPEQREDAQVGNGLTVFGLKASPDGKHLIMFVGMAHGC